MEEPDNRPAPVKDTQDQNLVRLNLFPDSTPTSDTSIRDLSWLKVESSTGRKDPRGGTSPTWKEPETVTPVDRAVSPTVGWSSTRRPGSTESYSGRGRDRETTKRGWQFHHHRNTPESGLVRRWVPISLSSGAPSPNRKVGRPRRRRAGGRTRTALSLSPGLVSGPSVLKSVIVGGGGWETSREGGKSGGNGGSGGFDTQRTGRSLSSFYSPPRLT